jgi:hypothetical protein
VNSKNYGENGEQIVKNFRTVVSSYVNLFRSQRNHVHHLLGGRHHYSSGAFREGLLRDFLASVLPKSISVDSGFIYGFDQVPNSKQIDILVWDSGRHAAVFRAGEFVIVPPEAVIAAISVKTALHRAELIDALDNLASVSTLDTAFRMGTHRDTGALIHEPILKAVVAYEGPANVETALQTVQTFYEDLFSKNPEAATEMRRVFSTFDPIQPSEESIADARRQLPMIIAAIESNEMSLVQGWGPPEDRFGKQTHGPGLRRLPFMYAQDSKLTTSLEKIVYQVLRSVYLTLGTTGWSLVAAWGEMHPRYGFRIGDSDEIIESTGVPLLDPQRLAGA